MTRSPKGKAIEGSSSWVEGRGKRKKKNYIQYIDLAKGRDSIIDIKGGGRKRSSLKEDYFSPGA